MYKRLIVAVLGLFILPFSAFSSENGIMSTYADSSFSGMNGVVETFYDGTPENYKSFNGIRTEIEPQAAKYAIGFNGIMDVFDADGKRVVAESNNLVRSLKLSSLQQSTFYQSNFKNSPSDKKALKKLFRAVKKGKVKLVAVNEYLQPLGYNDLEESIMKTISHPIELLFISVFLSDGK